MCRIEIEHKMQQIWGGGGGGGLSMWKVRMGAT